MFIVQLPSKDVVIQNDIKDVMQIFLGFSSVEKVEELYKWASSAVFGNSFKKEGLSVLCVSDETARKMASFYGVLPEFEKIYGKNFATMEYPQVEGITPTLVSFV